MILATTPRGSRTEKLIRSSEPGNDSPLISVARPANRSITARLIFISICMPLYGLPESIASSLANSSACVSISLINFLTQATRSLMSSFHHADCACEACPTTLSTVSADAPPTSRISSPVAGFCEIRSSSPLWNSPLKKRPVFVGRHAWFDITFFSPSVRSAYPSVYHDHLTGLYLLDREHELLS